MKSCSAQKLAAYYFLIMNQASLFCFKTMLYIRSKNAPTHIFNSLPTESQQHRIFDKTINYPLSKIIYHSKMSIYYHLLFCVLLSLHAFGQGPAPRAEINLDQAIDAFDLSGEGTLVIMIDRGIDYTHPTFIDENGNTRIAYIYDMIDPSGANNNPYNVGTIFDQDAINTSLSNGGNSLSTDRGGHGTATTSIICGNGLGAANSNFKGVAPKATIISIKITNDPFPAFGDQPGQSGFFDPNLIPTALQFAQDKITELGLPSVTLMNIGSIGGPTDGTSKISRAIDAFIESGNPFLCGVGDDGGADNHAAGQFVENATTELLIEKGESGFLRLDLWYNGEDQITFTIERPNGMTEGPFSALSGANDFDDNNLTDISIFHRGADLEFFEATSNRNELLIDFTGATGTYKLIIEGANIQSNGQFHATLNPSLYSNTNKFGSFVTKESSINDYAASNLVITPGDYVVQNTWVDINGSNRGLTGQGDPGEIWIGSSTGPTQDGRLGIDFVAPGEVCYGAYSPNTFYSNFNFNIIQGSNNLYGVQNAVSAAAPIVTGVIALMLEINPTLTPEEIKSILQETSRADSFTGSVPNNTWGYGKIDAFAALTRTQATVSIQPISATDAEIRMFPNPGKDRIYFQSVDENTFIERIQVTNLLGQTIYQNFDVNQPLMELNITDWNEGQYQAVIQTNRHKWSANFIKN